MVGDEGLVARWDGEAWELLASGTAADLYGIWGVSANDVWMVGEGAVIRRYNGSVFSNGRVGTLQAGLEMFTAVSGSAWNDVWITGYGYWNTSGRSLLYRWDGEAFVAETGGRYATYNCLELDTEDVWVGDRSELLHRGHRGLGNHRRPHRL